MKRAKIMLTAIAVLAVVGGALAFKAKAFNGQYIYTLDGGKCVFDGVAFTPDAGAATSFELVSTTNEIDAFAGLLTGKPN